MKEQEINLKQINKSGFPFQLRIENEICNSHNKHGWSIASHEHPWVNPRTGTKGFADIVLKHDQFSTFRLVIECKRVKADDARQLRWIFLLPDQNLVETNLTSCFEIEGNRDKYQEEYNYGFSYLESWDNVRLTPTSLQSEFCILQSDEQRKQPILESLGYEVIESVEGIAMEEIAIAKYNKTAHLRLFVFPAIVTNAEISVCRFNSDMVSLSNGTLEEKDVEITTVPFVRFRKSLETSFPYNDLSEIRKSYMFSNSNITNLRTASKDRERTIFVVNSKSLPEFLNNWILKPFDDFEGYAIQRL